MKAFDLITALCEFDIDDASKFVSMLFDLLSNDDAKRLLCATKQCDPVVRSIRQLRERCYDCGLDVPQIGKIREWQETAANTSCGMMTLGRLIRLCDPDLHTVAERGDELAIRALLEGGAGAGGVIDKDKFGWTALQYAVKFGSVECFRMLVQAGADIDITEEDGSSLLGMAATYGSDQCLLELLNTGMPVDMVDAFGRTALMNAATENHLTCLQHLLAAGANVNLAGSAGHTVLMFAAMADDEYDGECTRLLIEANADVDKATPRGWTALMYAVDQGNNESLRHLVKAVANIDAINDDGDGDTALILSAEKGNGECTRLLIQANADVDKATFDGSTALMVAASEGNYESLRHLIQGGANVNAQHPDGHSAILIAFANKDLDGLESVGEENVFRRYTHCLEAMWEANHHLAKIGCHQRKRSLVY